jgi:sugar transferase (PEP-CTERM/EpsH1 system associated)
MLALKILLLTQVLPYPPDSGPKVKTFNLIKYLSQRHEVVLVSFVRGDQSGDVEQLMKYCLEVLTVPMQRSVPRDAAALAQSLLSGLPWTIVRDRRSSMFALVEEVSRRYTFDVIHADQLNMAQYAEKVRAGRKTIDTHNALWLLYQRMAATMGSGPKKWLFERDARLFRGYEGRICREFDTVLAVSVEDQHALLEVAGAETDIEVIPITVDTDESLPICRAPNAGRILHIGTMFWPPNVDGILWFARQVLPLVRNARAEVEFDVVGARPPDEVVALGVQDAHVHVTGYVDETKPYLEQAGVMVVPLRAGGGMRVKILNALAQGMPVVTTSIGCEGIAVEHGKHLLIADTPEDFANAVVRLLENRNLADQLGADGRRLIERTYDYRAAFRPLDAIYHPNGTA